MTARDTAIRLLAVQECARDLTQGPEHWVGEPEDLWTARPELQPLYVRWATRIVDALAVAGLLVAGSDTAAPAETADGEALASTDIVPRMTPEVATEVLKLVTEGYGALRYGVHAMPDWHERMLRVIEDIAGQLKAGGHRG